MVLLDDSVLAWASPRSKLQPPIHFERQRSRSAVTSGTGARRSAWTHYRHHWQDSVQLLTRLLRVDLPQVRSGDAMVHRRPPYDGTGRMAAAAEVGERVINESGIAAPTRYPLFAGDGQP